MVGRTHVVNARQFGTLKLLLNTSIFGDDIIDVLPPNDFDSLIQHIEHNQHRHIHHSSTTKIELNQ